MRARLLLSLIITPFLFAAQNAFAFSTCVAVKYRDTPVCLDKFVCTGTPQSTFVREVCYDPAKLYMLIELLTLGTITVR